MNILLCHLPPTESSYIVPAETLSYTGAWQVIMAQLLVLSFFQTCVLLVLKSMLNEGFANPAGKNVMIFMYRLAVVQYLMCNVGILDSWSLFHVRCSHDVERFALIISPCICNDRCLRCVHFTPSNARAITVFLSYIPCRKL